MQIKRVDILGFKSFVDKVSLDFNDGVTAILGPNGCGKSNVVDAIRWAMGEQNAKNLRGRSMEDIIFGGSESRRPLGMAEVSMVFSNADGLAPAAFKDYAEIMVTRRLYRNGDSEYLINKTPCRLMDITELFMDTGIGARAYSIIEQGKIGMILNSKPEDRRFLIEEAAGVTKFKSRKKSALRKIEATKQNLLRLGDIVSEVRRQLGSLKRQAQKAQKFRECREELKSLETRLTLQRYLALKKEIDSRQQEEQEQVGLMERFKGQVEQGELTLEELRLRHVTVEKEVAEGQEQVFHLTSEIQRIEGQIGFGGKEMEGLLRQQERQAAESQEVRRRLEEVASEQDSLLQDGSMLGADLQQEQRSLAAAEATAEELSFAEQSVATRLEETRTALFALLTHLSQLSHVHEDARRRLQSLEERTSRNRQEAVSLLEQQEQAQMLIAELESALQGFLRKKDVLLEEQVVSQETLRSLKGKLEENENRLLIQREELNRHRSRLESLKELERSLEGYGGGVKALLKNPEMRQRFGAVAAEILEVAAEFERAVESVLGDRLQAVLADRGDDVMAALDFLREAGGRCTFLLPPFPAEPLPPVEGGRPLASLVMPATGAAARVETLLHGVFLVDSLYPWLGKPLPPGVTLVTMEGEILTGRGELQGGSTKGIDEGLLHKKREMKELADGVKLAEARVEQWQQERLDLREQLSQEEENLREIGAALHRKEIKVFDNEKDLNRLKQDFARLTERLEVLSLEEDQLHEEREGLEKQQREANDLRLAKEQEKTVLEESLAELQEEMQVRKRALEDGREKVTALKVIVTSLREREESSRKSQERLETLRRELQGRLALLKSQQEEAEEERARLELDSGRLRTELEVLFRKREEEKKSFDRLKERFDESARHIEEHEDVLKGTRSRMNDLRETLSSLQLKTRELDMEAEHLREGVLDRYRLDLAEMDAPEEDLADSEAMQTRASDLRRVIDDMGEVNLTAIEEYRELEERFSFLTGQQEDLKTSLEGLQTAISKINRTTRKRFRETFDLVNAKFQEVFPRLFLGGKAELALTDEEDLLETGIDIIVQPPGKRLQSVNLLSGGEKALTAVALIFSIFLIKPSPFCMLDEVDAPLDDANIGRFNDIVRQMSAASQFIIITHNKRTMEIADTLYGVTMEEPGVSKLVSVRFNELEG
ncbi:chromosome segregation protein SMC [Desulfuromonas sp. AOP6]|uniref:chromosome segregation protein SMC n=1 Tax=Desulfuromonas sp. AOP6 TaxID=1566351 RepID=UPI001281A915|nr:chromosome segregation protein SMC [Desulfuromonas sp. AOP6]BCA79166.1 chromosome partition protein Smc [Desulfuromonas sp. AOP6]